MEMEPAASSWAHGRSRDAVQSQWLAAGEGPLRPAPRPAPLAAWNDEAGGAVHACRLAGLARGSRCVIANVEMGAGRSVGRRPVRSRQNFGGRPDPRPPGSWLRPEAQGGETLQRTQITPRRRLRGPLSERWALGAVQCRRSRGRTASGRRAVRSGLGLRRSAGAGSESGAEQRRHRCHAGRRMKGEGVRDEGGARSAGPRLRVQKSDHPSPTGHRPPAVARRRQSVAEATRPRSYARMHPSGTHHGPDRPDHGSTRPSTGHGERPGVASLRPASMCAAREKPACMHTWPASGGVAYDVPPLRAAGPRGTRWVPTWPPCPLAKNAA